MKKIVSVLIILAMMISFASFVEAVPNDTSDIDAAVDAMFFKKIDLTDKMVSDFAILSRADYYVRDDHPFCMLNMDYTNISIDKDGYDLYVSDKEAFYNALGFNYNGSVSIEVSKNVNSSALEETYTGYVLFSADIDELIWETGTPADYLYMYARIYYTLVEAAETVDFELSLHPEAVLYGTQPISETSSFYVDVNYDGKFNGRDLTQIKKYISGNGVKINFAAADQNGDGKINGRDLQQIKKKIAGAE